ncbi:MAG TPA: DUF1735 domain-containing protein [Chitinophagaceae bacterium]|nr:DUF1735 domain-containing protein [Chitinophagaceae bacterium]
MKIIKSYTSWFLLLFVIGITSCEKAEIKDGGGKTLVKIIGGGEEPVILPMDVTPQIEEMLIADLRKDAATQADASAATTVTITNTQAFLDAYNTANGTAYELLPTSAYTITPESGVTVNGNTWTISLAPGELARPISITLDKSQLDLSKSYAFGLQITQTTVGSASLANGVAIVNLVIINIYHGEYHATGVFHHPTAGDRAIDEDKDLMTVGASSVKTNLGDLGTSGYQMVLTVDPLTNNVTITPAGATPNIDQSWGLNYYDPITESFHLHYSYNVSAPRIIEETITRK